MDRATRHSTAVDERLSGGELGRAFGVSSFRNIFRMTGRIRQYPSDDDEQRETYRRSQAPSCRQIQVDRSVLTTFARSLSIFLSNGEALLSTCEAEAMMIAGAGEVR